jgi:KEOPS complex subunit Pcc1
VRADIRIKDREHSRLLRDSLQPEVGGEYSKSKVKIDLEGEELVLSIEAEDVTALRAAVNSYLRWMKLALDASRALEV